MIEKQLPAISSDSVVKEYMSMLLNQGKNKEYKDTKELLQYIVDMEKQFQEVVKELHEVKELLNGLQNSSTKSKLSIAVNKVQDIANDGIKKLNYLKEDIKISMKNCLETFKEKGKNGVMKTINILHFKEALQEMRKHFFRSMNKTVYLIQTCDSITSEMRSAKRNIANIGSLILGKSIQNQNQGVKLSFIQKSSRSMFALFKSMTIKTTTMLHKLEDFEKTSVKTEIRLLSDVSKTKNTKRQEKKEQMR